MPRAFSSVAAACALFGQRVTAHAPNIPEHEHSREQDKMEKLHMVRASRARFWLPESAVGKGLALAMGLCSWLKASLLSLSMLLLVVLLFCCSAGPHICGYHYAPFMRVAARSFC